MKTKTDSHYLQFQIKMLRKDKIIYATESIAINTLCFLIVIFSEKYLSGLVLDIIQNGALICAVVYAAYMGVGNLLRLRKIKKLEKTLSGIYA